MSSLSHYHYHHCHHHHHHLPLQYWFVFPQSQTEIFIHVFQIYKKKLSEERETKHKIVNNLQEEFQKQIMQLYSDLRHKNNLLQMSEVDKQQMEEDMETLYMAAQNENSVMYQLLNGISCNKNIVTCCDSDEENVSNCDSDKEIILPSI
ncbi:uncharacterized protein LOC128249881 [Octopus bimaculoides]|uniref:uncharacterized protein LOC128249881 n=1 Tax=Octopus bimaculoides TaxID=37653 RepID=UPI0022E65DE5|nr:uncharacterized protein LOC128249881 [Octopus bimaculoides]